jgi:voltage-gated potassium channel
MKIMEFRQRITLAFILCNSVLGIGTAGFMLIENYSFIDGLYMSAITISTVGFGEVLPLSAAGRLFTTGLILCSFLALAFAGHTVGQSLLENVWSGRAERKKMSNKIKSLKDHYIVCGYGRVGAAAVEQLKRLASECVVIENDENQISLLKEKGYLYLVGDATHEELLEEAGIKRAQGLLSLLNNDPDNLFVVLTAREMNPTLNIVSRVDESSAGHKIIRAGADDVVSPFDSAGQQIASEILKASQRIDSISDMQCSQGLAPKWITIESGSSMIDQSIQELSLEMQRPVIGLRRNRIDHLEPDKTTRLQEGDRILVLDEIGETVQNENEHPAEPRKLVIVDDNPVIVKLYSRLFQKAGFIPFIAKDGKEGLGLILDQKPQAAVIDYHLPKISGIDVCQRVRKQMNGDPIKLILFTTDESPRTRQSALASGADAVVVKSSDASEIIRTVSHFFKV